jgi:RHS repeat-associated protein
VPPAGVPAPGVQYFHRNQVNSTTLVTHAAGALAARVAYLPFGEIASLTGSDTFRAKFAGRELDEETGLSYFGARYYSAALGRFITPDDQLGGPLGHRDICNTYAYVLNSPVCHVDPTGHGLFDDIGSGFKAMGEGVAKGFESAGEHIKSTAKQWVPYVVDGVLIVAGAAILATVPFGGPVSGIIGGALLGAGISGLAYQIEAQAGHKSFSWEHWGVQLGIGAATGAFTGAAFEGAGYLASEEVFDLAIGSLARTMLMGAAGAVSGAGSNAFSTYVTNIDNGRPGAEGVGWAATVGAVTGFVGGAVAERMAGKDFYSEEVWPEAEPAQDFWEAYGKPFRRRLNDVWWKKVILRAPYAGFTSGGKAVLYLGPNWSW